jgi:hypothetical protein
LEQVWECVTHAPRDTSSENFARVLANLSNEAIVHLD